MKKTFIIILSCLFIILAISYVKINLTKLDNNNITNKIAKIKKENEKLDNEKLEIEKQINALKEEEKDKWQELNMWQKTKEKIERTIKKRREKNISGK